MRHLRLTPPSQLPLLPHSSQQDTLCGMHPKLRAAPGSNRTPTLHSQPKSSHQLDPALAPPRYCALLSSSSPLTRHRPNPYPVLMAANSAAMWMMEEGRIFDPGTSVHVTPTSAIGTCGGGAGRRTG